MIINFGKYKGREVEELPSQYLEWFLDTIENKPRLYEAIEEEYNFREKTNTHWEEDD